MPPDDLRFAGIWNEAATSASSSSKGPLSIPTSGLSLSLRQLQTSVAYPLAISGVLMSITDMAQPTRLLAARAGVRDEVPPTFGMIPAVRNIARSAFSGIRPPTRLVGVTERIIETEMASSEEETLRNRALRTATVPLTMEWFDGVIRTIQLTVVDLEHVTDEICLDGQTIGFIGRAGGIFVAQSGIRLDRAEECGQCLFWDKAATILVALSGDHLELDERDPREEAQERFTRQ